MRTKGGKFWLTPAELYRSLDDEFQFDFDPCPYPRPRNYNSLVVPWGSSNYVNPPFLKKDAPHGGPAAFARKAIEERDNGKTSVVVLPATWSIGLLMEAGAEVRYLGRVRWVEADSGELSKRNYPQVMAILKGGTGK